MNHIVEIWPLIQSQAPISQRRQQYFTFVADHVQIGHTQWRYDYTWLIWNDEGAQGPKHRRIKMANRHGSKPKYRHLNANWSFLEIV